MKLGIDASNLRAGGGVNHLAELLRVEQPRDYGFDQIVVWSGRATLDRLEEKLWLRKVHEPLLDKALPMRLYWQHFMLDRLVRREKCDLLFVPGGLYFGAFRPFVAMSQNLIPFQWREIRRYGLSRMFLRNVLLFFAQKRTFKAAAGLIFLTRYAQDVVMKKIKGPRGRTTVIAHGVDRKFLLPPRAPRDLKDCSLSQPLRILYVSSIDLYKHQWHVVQAVAGLREAGYPLQLDFIGSAYPAALKRLRAALLKFDAQEKYIHYRGAIPYGDILPWYLQADLFVFASSCETFGQIVTEAMAAGLAIACSNKGPMVEILGGSGVYFDPEKPSEIAAALKRLIDDPATRADRAKTAHALAQAYTWPRCINDTFTFLGQIAASARR